MTHDSNKFIIRYIVTAYKQRKKKGALHHYYVLLITRINNAHLRRNRRRRYRDDIKDLWMWIYLLKILMMMQTQQDHLPYHGDEDEIKEEEC